ncbi:MAG TPA: hypothetical protein VKB95_04620, partial [Chitinophagaceae bacterium]|nr:hypothetical protein [Chitinophagaceae bacterium]
KNFLLLKNKSNEYVCNESDVSSRVSGLVELSVSSTNKEIYSLLLEECSDDERINRLLISTISVLGKDKILALSEKLQVLAFDSIATPGNIFNYADALELLKAVAAKGRPTHTHALTNVIMTKLQKDEMIIQGLDIIESLNDIDTSDKRRIKVELERIVDMDEFKERASTILQDF